MKETRTLILTSEEVEDAVRAYIFDKKGVHVESVRFDIGLKTVDHMLDIDIHCLNGAFVVVSE
jgi:hypothetical protein